LKELDRQWPDMPLDEGEMAKILNNPIADVLQVVLREDERLVGIQVTDGHGQLVAASGRTNDFYQADEEWWKRCYNDGRGRIYIQDVNFNRICGVWCVSVCVPIRHNRKLVGLAKTVVALQRWLPAQHLSIGEGQGDWRMLCHDGYIMHSRQTVEGKIRPLQQRQADWESLVTVGPEGHWRISDETLQAYIPVTLPTRLYDLEVEMPHWTLLQSFPVSEVQKGLTRLTVIMLLIGLISISALFMGGVLLIDRSLINRIRRLGRSARYVAGGELHHRADSHWAGTRFVGKDEIDDLGHDFNNMVRKLQRSHEELTEANLLKENFIRIAGHELRTPVSYIVGMANLMKNSQDVERLSKAVETMGFKAGRLDEIIQSMFKLLPEQALAEDMEITPVSLSKLLESVYLDCQPWIERRNQRLVIDVGESDTVIRVDEAKLRDVIENLAMNAIKFTPNEGEIRITVRRQLGGYVAIEVIDQGPGIPESDRPHVFEPFYSGSDTLKHSTGKSGYGKKGMGLGLAIAKHFVDLHGGSIDFTTGPNGTTFIIQLSIESHNNGRGPDIRK
jgi:signal transduction histidine kinase